MTIGAAVEIAVDSSSSWAEPSRLSRLGLPWSTKSAGEGFRSGRLIAMGEVRLRPDSSVIQSLTWGCEAVKNLRGPDSHGKMMLQKASNRVARCGQAVIWAVALVMRQELRGRLVGTLILDQQAGSSGLSERTDWWLCRQRLRGAT